MVQDIHLNKEINFCFVKKLIYIFNSYIYAQAVFSINSNIHSSMSKLLTGGVFLNKLIDP